MNGLLPLMAALALAEAATRIVGGAEAALAGWPRALAWVAGALLIAAAIGEIAARLLARHGERWHRNALDWWDMAAQGIGLALYAGVAWPGPWTGGWAVLAQHSYTLAILPWLALQTVHWWTFARAFAGAGWHRQGYVLHQLRFGMLPVIAALPVMDLCDTFARATGYDQWLNTHLGLAVNAAGSFLVAVALVALLPALLVRLWGARPLPPGPQLDDLTAACARFGVPVGGILVWPVDGGRITNAMVLGLVPRLRWVLITPDLLERFPRDQLHAVLGHELGHVRHHHLWIYLLFAGTAGMASWWLKDPLVQLAAGSWPFDPEILRAGIALILLAVAWRLVFGVLSRVCERQADLAGAELAGAPGIMQRALLAVAHQSGADPASPSWRHGAIAHRAAFLTAADADPGLVRRHHRLVRGWVAGLLLTAVLVTILLLTTHPDLLPA